MTNRGRSRTAFLREGECCKGSGPKWSTSTTFRAFVDREVSEGVPLQNLKKLPFSNSIRCIPFANILLKTIIHFQ